MRWGKITTGELFQNILISHNQNPGPQHTSKFILRQTSLLYVHLSKKIPPRLKLNVHLRISTKFQTLEVFSSVYEIGEKIFKIWHGCWNTSTCGASLKVSRVTILTYTRLQPCLRYLPNTTWGNGITHYVRRPITMVQRKERDTGYRQVLIRFCVPTLSHSNC